MGLASSPLSRREQAHHFTAKILSTTLGMMRKRSGGMMAMKSGDRCSTQSGSMDNVFIFQPCHHPRRGPLNGEQRTEQNTRNLSAPKRLIRVGATPNTSAKSVINIGQEGKLRPSDQTGTPVWLNSGRRKSSTEPGTDW